MTDEAIGFRAAQHGEGADPPGAVASFPYDRLTVEKFRAAFPGARWREDLRAWFVPGATAERRLLKWSGREWPGVLAHADARGRDAFAFDPIASRYLEAADDLVVRTPYSKAVVEELRGVPWARWDPDTKAWRVPFRSSEDLRRRWPAIEEAARRAEPAERERRRAERRASAGDGEARERAAERRGRRYPVPETALPPLGRAVMTHAGPAVFEAITGELADPAVAARFYPAVSPGPGVLLWAGWRRPSHGELVRTWPARGAPAAEDLARGWWQPTIEVLRVERRKAASAERGRAARLGARFA